MGYFDTDHLIAPPITFGSAPGFWQSFKQGVSQQFHVDSAYSLDDEVQNRYLKSLRTYEDLTGHKTNFPVDAEFLDDYIRTTQGSGPSYWHRNVFTGELGQRYKQYIDEFQKADEGIKALGRPDIPSMAQVLADVSQMQHSTEEETQRQWETGGVGATIARFAGGAVGSFTPRDPLNLATLPIGGFGKSVVTRIATEGVLQAGIAGVTDASFVNPNRQLVGLPAHNIMYDMLLAAGGGAVIRGLGEGAVAGFRRLTGRTPEIRPEAPTNEELRTTLDTLPDSPRVRAGHDILDAVEDIERVNPYGDGLQGHARFMEELRRVQNAMNGEPETAIARFLPPLPEVPAEHIESNFDFQLVKEQRPELYDRMQATRAAISDVEQRIADTEQGVATLAPSDAIARIDEASGELIRSYEQELQNPALTAERRADIQRKVNTVVQTLGPENVERELRNASIKPKKELQSLRQSRKAAVRRYKDAYNAVQAEADRIKLHRDIIARAQTSKEIRAIVAGKRVQEVNFDEPLYPISRLRDAEGVLMTDQNAPPKALYRIMAPGEFEAAIKEGTLRGRGWVYASGEPLWRYAERARDHTLVKIEGAEGFNPQRIGGTKDYGGVNTAGVQIKRVTVIGVGRREHLQQAFDIGSDPAFRAFVTERLGSPNWTAAPRLTKALQAHGLEHVVTPKQLKALHDEYISLRAAEKARLPLISLQAAEDIAATTEAADKAMPERVDTLITKQPDDGTVDIGLETPVPGDRFFLDEGGQKVTFAKTMADLADDDRTAEAMRTCLL